MAKKEAGRFTFPSEGQRSPAENIARVGAGQRSPAENIRRISKINRGGGGTVSRDKKKEQKLIEETRRKGRERLERLAREQKAKTDAAKREKDRIIKERKRMIEAKARIVRKKSRDKKTGDELRIIETVRKGVKIREVRNITTGETRFERFAPGSSGGGRRQTLALTAQQRRVSPTALETITAFVKNPDAFTSSEVVRGVREVGVVPSGGRLGFPTFGEKLDVLPDETRKLIDRKSEKDKKKILDTLFILGLEFTIPITEAVAGAKQLPSTVKGLIDDPSKLKDVPSNILTSLKETGKEITALAKVSPSRAVARIGGELFLIFASGKALRVAGKVTGRAANKINPFLKRIKKGKLIVKTTRGRTTLRVGGTVKKIAQPLKKQATVAGKKVTAVSAQADRLVNIIKTKRVIRKPIPGEALLSNTTKKLLKKFDDGNITPRQLNILDDAIRVETKGAGNLLERSFFADPSGRFRPSRLGISAQKDASLLDILKGDFTFKTSKPQIMVFENVKVAKFPAALKDIEKALKSGKTLTQSQSKRLLAWQSKKTGQFKPIGALSKEPEITLAPGEILKKVKKMGNTVVNGKKVEIVQVKVVKPSASVKSLLKKAKSGKITAKELKQLQNKLKKETGFKARLSRSKRLKPRARIPKRLKPRARKVKRVTRIKRKGRLVRGSPAAKRFMRKIRAAKKPKRVSPRRTVARRGVVRKKVRRRAIPRRGIIRKKARATKKTEKKAAKKARKVKIKKNEKGFDVFAKPIKTKTGKKAKRFLKINKVALSKKRAEDLRNYITDTSLSRTAKLKATKKKPGKPRLNAPSGYAKKTKPKFRKFRIIKGKRKKLRSGKVIEKKTRLLDTRQERQKITLRKRIKQITKPKKSPVRKRSVKRVVRRTPVRNTKRRITPSQRKVMFANLKKARLARARNLKKIKTIGRSVKRPVAKRTPARRTPLRKAPTPPKRRLSPSQLRQQRLRNLAKGRRTRLQNLKRRKK